MIDIMWKTLGTQPGLRSQAFVTLNYGHVAAIISSIRIKLISVNVKVLLIACLNDFNCIHIKHVISNEIL